MLAEIFMQIMDMSKIASVVILIVILARLFLKKAPKIVSYALWAVVLFRLLCPLSIEAPVSIIPDVTPASQSNGLAHESNSAAGAGLAVSRAVSDAQNGGLGVRHIQTTDTNKNGNFRHVTSDGRDVWILLGQYVWIAGIAAMLIYSVASCLKIHRKLKVVVPLRDNIYIADDIQSPFVIGFIRPKIFLPCGLNEKEQEYIILHEQNHIKRFDHIFKALAFLALCIHWFNPLVWFAFVLAGKDMEMSCDEAVVRKMGEGVRADYSASLLTLATGHRIIAGTPLAFGEGDTKGRIKNLEKWKKPVLWVVIAAVTACLVLAVCLLTNPITKQEPLAWAQELSPEEVASADLVVVPQAEDKQFKTLSEDELTSMVALINQSKGKYQDKYEELAGGSIFFYLSMKDGSAHSVGNMGNTYLVIDGTYYEAEYDFLSKWDNNFGEGNSTIPNDYFNSHGEGRINSNMSDIQADLEQYRTDYVGDAPKAAAIAQNLPYPKGYSYASIELQTDKQPYGMTVRLAGNEAVGRDDFVECASLSFDLIGNLGTVAFWVEDHLSPVASFERENCYN